VTTHDEAAPELPSESTPHAPRPLGLLAVGGAVLAFSFGSTLVKKAGIPGTTMAFWRMAMTSFSWGFILWATERRFVRLDELRRALLPGVLFGVNITLFFIGVTTTSVANAEFIGSLTPLILVPVGAIVFKEHIDRRALWFGLVSLLGLAIVLFNAPSTGAATWQGNVVVGCAMLTWSSYLLTSRMLRRDMSVQAIMAAIMPVATVTIFPIALIRGELDDVTAHSLLYMVILAVITGTIAHGLIVYAQHTVPISTIGMMQVAQPALAVCWAYLILDQIIRPVQLIGMALVLIGLLAVVITTRRALEPETA
jgi:drug/metabolite transporter (DMT)-like permease